MVIDVLRATSTVAQALAAGYERVHCCESVESALALRGHGRVVAGEREWAIPPGFDLGNSPSEFVSPRGEEVVLATTNGSPMMAAAAAHGDQVLLASLLNLEAVVAALSPADVLLAGAGTNGRPALEDIYAAGRIATVLPGQRTDAALAAQCVAAGYPAPMDALSDSEDARALVAVGLEDDLRACARESMIDAVPEAVAGEAGVALVTVDAHAQPYGKRTKSHLQPVSLEV